MNNADKHRRRCRIGYQDIRVSVGRISGYQDIRDKISDNLISRYPSY